MSRVILKKISIIDLDADCVVNPANSSLKAGGGVCGQIFEAAGYEELTKACNRIGGCKCGSAVITPAFNMKQKYIIHAVGPIWSGGREGEAFLLRSAYRSALDLAVQNNCASIGFPLISAGIYGYPIKQAWEEALQAVYDFLKVLRDIGYDLDIYFAALKDEILWTGKSELDKQQALFDQWCEQMNSAPMLYGDDDDIPGIFENRIINEPSQNNHGGLSGEELHQALIYNDSPYIDPELLFSDMEEKKEEPVKPYIPENTDTGCIVFFWNPDEENGCLSQWYKAPMSVDGVEYSCCEQYMMAKKALAMGDLEHYVLIMHESEPEKIRAFGREVRNFDSEKWSSIVSKIIYDGNFAKFSQNPELKARLLETGNSLLAEASPTDLKYGIGYKADDPLAFDPANWKGSNLMGETLMRVRNDL